MSEPKPQIIAQAPVLSKSAAETATPVLPDAGYQRTETLARNRDTLQEQAEVLANAREMWAIRKDAFDEEREIQALIQRSGSSGLEDYFACENLDWDHYGYRMVQCTYPRDTPGRFFNMAKLDGFDAVTGDTINLTNGRPVVNAARYTIAFDFDNAIKVGDLVLMQTELYRYHAWQEARTRATAQATKQARGYGLTAAPGTIVHEDANDPIVQRLTSQGGAAIMEPVPNLARQALAKSLADGQFADMLKEGTVPGAEIRR